MAGYLIAEEGPLAGLILRFEEGDEWVIGRDPDEVELVLEDPMVSRKHVICRRAPEGYILENLSAVNPATQNGKIITEPVLLQEGDIIQVGNTFFRFSERAPESDQGSPLFLEEASDLATLSMATPPDARWMIKVITGPNSGAEFFMQKGRSYIIGKDPEVCDIIFQDLSVSRQHAKITLDDEAQVYHRRSGKPQRHSRQRQTDHRGHTASLSRPYRTGNNLFHGHRPRAVKTNHYCSSARAAVRRRRAC